MESTDPKNPEKETQEAKKEVERFTKEKLIDGLKNKKFKKISFMTGAGISVAAGIPDFRSPDTGLYANLKEYDIPTPQSIFTLDYFKEKPEPFYKLAKEFLDMNKFKATYVHHFCKMLKDKDMVNYYMTQNIDNLEEQTGMKYDNGDLIQAHGANRGASCAICGKKHDAEVLKQKISKGEVMYCDDDECKGPIKPDITFFGEQLPTSFMHAMIDVGKETDLMIVIGTSLSVGPFNATVNMVQPGVPKVLINLENTALAGFEFDDPEKFPERLFLQGKSQDTIQEIAEACGWKDDLLKRKEEADKKHDAEQAERLTAQMSSLGVGNEESKEEDGQIDSSKEKDPEQKVDEHSKVEKKEQEEPESGPIMGFFAVEPIKECPHCIPDEYIACIEEFKDVSITTPCFECGHCQENWVCLKTKRIGCSRYVNNHMRESHEKGNTGPIVLSFADFSFWCYICDSYVVSKHLNHVKHFYPQKFGAESASHMQEYAGIMASKARKDKEN